MSLYTTGPDQVRKRRGGGWGPKLGRGPGSTDSWWGAGATPGGVGVGLCPPEAEKN